MNSHYLYPPAFLDQVGAFHSNFRTVAQSDVSMIGNVHVSSTQLGATRAAVFLYCAQLYPSKLGVS